MGLITKNKSDFLLILLFAESILLSLVLESKGMFWFLFVVAAATVFFYSVMVLKVQIKDFWSSGSRDDILFIVAMTTLLNANIMIFPNRIVLSAIFLGYYVGLRYLIWTLSKERVSQVQKNALNLSGLFLIFLGSNFNANIGIILEKSLGGVVLLPLTALLFVSIYLVSFYTLTKNSVKKVWVRTYSLTLSLILSETALLAGFYLERYPSIYRTENASNMSIVTLPLFLIVIYYMLYGLMIHKVQKRINPRLLMEYIGISTVIMATLFITIKWFAG